MSKHACGVLVATIGAVGLCQIAWADEAKPATLPVVTVVPEADFSKHASLGRPAVSPDGQYIAVSVHNTENGESKYQLAVLHLPDLKFISRLDMTSHYLPIDITWVDNKRLVMGVGEETAFSEAPTATGDIIAVDMDGKNKRVLYSDMLRGSMGAQRNILKIPVGFGSISGTPDHANGHFYLSVYPAAEGGGTDAQAHKSMIFDIEALTGSVKELGEIDEDGYQFIVHEGVVRYAFGEDNNLKEHVYYRADSGGHWTELPPAVVGRNFEPLAVSADGSHLYALGNPTGGPNELTISNLDGTDRKVLASDPRVSISRVYWTPAPHEPFAAVASDGKPKITYLADNKYSAILKSLNAKFSDHFVGIADISEDGGAILVGAASDRDPGTFALFETATNNLRPLYQIKPWLKADKLGERKPFWFKASSGTELEGFVTLPPHRSAKNLPTVLIAHGGPLGIADPWDISGSWENLESQFLATRGYAVVQVNYRGSGGRGKNFEDSGRLQMGSGMMQDMLDGLKWSEDQGYTDKNRVCVYGASYGGYTAFFQPVYAPQGTFKCSVAIAGVSDIRVQANRSDTRRSRAGRNFLREAWGMDDPAYVAANSAIDHIDKFNTPVLIIHGEDDKRVPIQNAREMRDALEKAGKPVEYMTKPKEGHGFFKEDNNTDRYVVTEKFLEKYLGPGAPIAD
jgi:dipeptidyl aminopeptidase/acylaminoacyl peptidase